MAPTRARTRSLPELPPRRELGRSLDVLRLIWGVDHRLNSVSKYLLRKWGISGPQRLSLKLIGRCPGISAGELSEMLQINPSTFSGILKRIVEAGLVERRIDDEDGRRVLLTLTERGRVIDQHAEGTAEAAVTRVLERYTPECVTSVRDLLLELNREFDKELQTAWELLGGE